MTNKKGTVLRTIIYVIICTISIREAGIALLIAILILCLLLETNAYTVSKLKDKVTELQNRNQIHFERSARDREKIINEVEAITDLVRQGMGKG